MTKKRVVLAVCVAWVIIALFASAQASISSALTSGSNARVIPLPTLVRSAFVNVLPWIPVSLAAIALALRLPLRRSTWRKYIGIHVAAALSLAFAANAIAVLGFWWTNDGFQGLRALLRASVLWTTMRLDLAVLTYGATVAITQVVLYQRRAQQRELELAKIEGQLARAHVQALNAQIRPHFLFNTLHTIGQLWRSGRSDDADAVLDHLGALFHKVHASTARVTISLADELAIVSEYMAIEEARYPDRLRARISAGDDVLDCEVPPLLLQPIVENAVRHGISAVSSAGQLSVSAARVDDKLRLIVHDDGPGPLATTRQARSGMGLRNTQERLAQMYGRAATLHIEGDAIHGTTVTIDLPLPPAATPAL